MIKKFIQGNKKAIKTAFKWTSLIFTSIVLIIFAIGLINNQKPDIGLFITVVLSASIGFPFFIIIVGFLRWSWDSSVSNRNFGSFPFSQLESIGFKKVTKNEESKTKFISDYYTGKIGDFIVDCDVDTQNESKQIRFKYFANIRPLGKTEYKRIQNDFKTLNGFFDFNWISKKYHYKNHQIKSISDLEKELIDFGKLIIKENIEPSDYAKR
nr:hypothetical protein [uncultured Draconibacterium sp.]